MSCDRKIGEQVSVGFAFKGDGYGPDGYEGTYFVAGVLGDDLKLARRRADALAGDWDLLMSHRRLIEDAPAPPVRMEHCTQPEREWCDCDWCRVCRSYERSEARRMAQ